MAVSTEFISEVKTALRVKSSFADSEVEGLIEACNRDLMISGVQPIEGEPLYRQAVKLYCKAHYGYDDPEICSRFREMYQELKNSMAISGEYEDGGETDG